MGIEMREPAGARVNLRVVTYNIHKCIGGVDRQYRPERISKAITPFTPDCVFIQEVDEGARRSLGHRQVDLLGDLLNLPHRVYFPNVKVQGGGHYGNAILSRFPIRCARNIDITVPNAKRRSVLHAEIRVRPTDRTGKSRTVHLYNLHLGLSQSLRDRQLSRFLSSHPFVSSHPRTPIILAGDFNDVWGTLGKKWLVPNGFRGPKKPLRTFPAWAPIRALDAVYVRGDAELTELRRSPHFGARWASDHLPLVAGVKV
jgi:endonuclease/exonuclease/phosphatase family metal-dependent hydrolase